MEVAAYTPTSFLTFYSCLVPVKKSGQPPKAIAEPTAIAFSNSMIEAANKQLKYRFLYHQKINDFSKLDEYIEKAILDFNHRPRAVLHGLTPMGVH